MLDMHEFWITMFPVFKESYEFVYYILDLFSILALLRIFFELPTFCLGFTGKMKW